ncbi:hypothetical protein BGZ70_002364 [Mortierella alpina]|uniref:Uncharacterized protein n=1 Tax=Mortierella alpina TaxID=64518 RepID=A0A9P6JBU5_MORAP|nr:hypothetical protein BGZ70_002364 [Mortierella alpina]
MPLHPTTFKTHTRTKGVRGLPSLLNDATVPKEDVHSFAGKRVHVDLMGTYFALIRALYCKLLREEAAKFVRQSALGTAFVNVHEVLRTVLHFGPQHDPRLRFIAEALHKTFERSGFDQTPNYTVIHLDGQRPYEKRREHAARAAKDTTVPEDNIDSDARMDQYSRAIEGCNHISRGIKRNLQQYAPTFGLEKSLGTPSYIFMIQIMMKLSTIGSRLSTDA